MNGLLDELGILAGTDKGSLGHDYLRHYERALNHLRDEPITLLEIGVAGGSSLRMWAEYFQRATVVGVDVNGAARKHAGDRRIVEIGSQGDPEFLATLSARYSPNVVVDDGSHQADHIIMTFQHLFPVLRPSGLYIVEDVHFHAGAWAHEHRGDAKTSPQAYFLALANLIVCPHEQRTETDAVAVQGIDAVEFFRGAVIVKKNPVPEPDPVARCLPFVERAGQPHLWSLLAGYALNAGRTPGEAVLYAQRAIDLDSKALGSYQMLSIARERAGDLPGAIEAQREAVRLDPHVAPFAARLAELEAQR